MNGGKKAGRQFNYDDEIEDARYNDFSDDYDDEDALPIRPPPRRSVTLSDFFAPGLLVKKDKDSTDENHEEEDHSPLTSRTKPQSPPRAASAKPPAADDYDDYYECDDSPQLKRCYEEIEERFDISDCDECAITDYLRENNYRTNKIWPLFKEGEFGRAVAKPQKPKKTQFGVQPKKATIQKQPTPALPTRSKSVTSLSKICDQHGDAKMTFKDVQTSISASKKHLNLVIVGHVDAGKSTLMGHLLLLQGKVEHSRMSAIERDSQRIGKAEDKFAWIMAEDPVERARGVTIDVAMTEFETKNLTITILDAPGHRDFVPNMIAGASQADAALLVIDVANPLLDLGQAKEHLLLCRAIGIQNYIVCINKMDSVYYDQSFYDNVVRQLTKLLNSYIGVKPLVFIPTAASVGVNLQKTFPDLLPWYQGPTVLQAIDSIPPPQVQNLLDSPFMLCVGECIENNNKLIISGKVESGYICIGDVIKINPYDSYAKVTQIRSASGGKELQFASPGVISEITVQSPLSSETVNPGSAISDLKKIVPFSNHIKAKVVTFDMAVPLLVGAALLFHRHAVDVALYIISIDTKIEKKTTIKNPGYLPRNSIGEITFRLDGPPIAMEKYSDSKTFGRFIIRAGGQTLGFGSVTEVLTPIVVNPKPIASDDSREFTK